MDHRGGVNEQLFNAEWIKRMKKWRKEGTNVVEHMYIVKNPNE